MTWWNIWLLCNACTMHLPTLSILYVSKWFEWRERLKLINHIISNIFLLNKMFMNEGRKDSTATWKSNGLIVLLRMMSKHVTVSRAYRSIIDWWTFIKLSYTEIKYISVSEEMTSTHLLRHRQVSLQLFLYSCTESILCSGEKSENALYMTNEPH